MRSAHIIVIRLRQSARPQGTLDPSRNQANIKNQTKHYRKTRHFRSCTRYRSQYFFLFFNVG